MSSTAFAPALPPELSLDFFAFALLSACVSGFFTDDFSSATSLFFTSSFLCPDSLGGSTAETVRAAHASHPQIRVRIARET